MTRLGKGLTGASLLVILVVVAGLVRSPVRPHAWHPAPALPLEGALAPNTHLQQAQWLGQGLVPGPEDVAVDAQGRLYAGLEDGRLVRLDLDGHIETLANTGGRPLGLDFDGAGNLVIADAYQGLMRLTPEGELQVLSRHAGDAPIRFADDVVVASDGRIYFSDASTWPYDRHKLDFFELKPLGRLLRYDPATGHTEVLLKDLYFANGVALAPNDEFVLVNETPRYRITRLWLRGDKAGQRDIFIDRLPGFPDGISFDGKGRFWVALAAPRDAALDAMHPYPWLKRWVAGLPPALLPAPKHYGWVLALDVEGQIRESLHDPEGKQAYIITSVESVGGYLYLGSLSNPAIGRLKLPPGSLLP